VGAVPTFDEALRVKAYLVVVRNQVRDYLDRSEEDDSVATVLVQRLAEPNPKDHTVIRQLSDYKGLTGKWQDWAAVTAACNDLAQRMLEGPAE